MARCRKALREDKTKSAILLAMEERRKRIVFLAAAMFMCRRLSGLVARPSPARELAFRDSVDLAVELLRRIDARFPSAPKMRNAADN